MSERDELVQRMKDIAADLQTDMVPRHEFLRRTGVSERKVQRPNLREETCRQDITIAPFERL